MSKKSTRQRTESESAEQEDQDAALVLGLHSVNANKPGKRAFNVTTALKDLIVTQALEIKVTLLVLILAGLKDCGKTDVVKNVYKAIVNPKEKEKDLSTVGEYNKEGLSWYEFAVAGNTSVGFDWSFFTRSSGYLRCFLSALVQYAEKHDLELLSDPPAANETNFENSTLNHHFHGILKGLHWQLRHEEHKWDHSNLSAGLSLVNVWDLEGMDKAVMLVLSLLVGQLNYSFAILGLNLEQQVKELSKSRIDDDTLFKDFLSLLRLVHLTRNRDLDREKACVIAGLVTTNQTQSKEASSEMELLMKQMITNGQAGIEKFFDDPWVLDANKPDQIKCLLEGLILKRGEHCTKTIPLSWVLLRSAFFKSGKLYEEREKLEKVASELEIEPPEFEQFLVDFTAMGSIIYNPNIQALKDYVVLNPVDFCYHLNNLFTDRFDGDLKKGIVPMSYLKRLFGSDADFFENVLTSSSLAINLDAHRDIKNLATDTQPPLLERTFCFIPIIRKAPPDTQKKVDSLFLLVKSTFLPNNVGQLLTKQLLSDSKTYLVPKECSNIAVFEYKEEVQFTVVFHSDACEIRLDLHSQQGESSDSSHLDLVEEVRALVLESCLYIVRNAEDECIPLSTENNAKNGCIPFNMEQNAKDECIPFSAEWNAKDKCIPFSTEIQGIGLTCAAGKGFHSFPEEVSCHECKENFTAWYHVYSTIIKTTTEVSKFFNCHRKVSPMELTTFGEKLSQLCSKEPLQQRNELLETLGLPQQSCSSPDFTFNIVSALYAFAIQKGGSSFALYQMLNSLSKEYGKLFRASFT